MVSSACLVLWWMKISSRQKKKKKMNRQRQAAMMKGGYDRKGECVNMIKKKIKKGNIFIFFKIITQ